MSIIYNRFKIKNLDKSHETCKLYIQIKVLSVKDDRGDVDKLSKVFLRINNVNYDLTLGVYPIF